MADANGKTEEDVSKTIIHLIGSKLWVTEQKSDSKKTIKIATYEKKAPFKYESHANWKKTWIPILQKFTFSCLFCFCQNWDFSVVSIMFKTTQNRMVCISSVLG